VVASRTRDRASFLLAAGYLLRDRETKLRIYPGLAPMLVMPFVFLLQERGRTASAVDSAWPFSGAYIGLVALLGLNLLQFSQQWPAADVFRVAPLAGPSRICDGARRAVICFLALPTSRLLRFDHLVPRPRSWTNVATASRIIAMPLFALYPHLGGQSRAALDAE
jgi:hypothetical protein